MTLRVAFRYDDYSNASPAALDREILDAFRRTGLPLTVGVIPCSDETLDSPHADRRRPLSIPRRRVLRSAHEAGIVEPALHGYDHGATGRDALDRDTEFHGLACEEQARRISAGRRMLAEWVGTAPTTFIPPWNSYDEATLRCLEDLGFETISAGRLAPETATSTLKFVPATARLHELTDVVRAHAGDDAIAVVLFHDYDFVEQSERWGELGFEDFTEILRFVAEREDVEVLSIAELADEPVELGHERLAAFSRLHRSAACRLVPASVFPESSTGVYPAAAHSRRRWTTRWIATLSWYLLVAAAGLLAGRGAGALIEAVRPEMVSSSMYFTSLLTLGVGAYALRTGSLRYRGLTCIVLLLTMLVGLSGVPV